jgi:SNF2 family DNA or RNA helicase
MLDIMGKYLDTKGIGFAEIRGSTKNRGQVIQKFQTNPSCQVFLGSLQAAGLGIDLTSGSIVIHYDRWWNAARENQATDRVHRLGQNRGVMVYKLMTKHSIEERIDKMIARKAKLFEDVIGCDDHRIIRKLSREELFELLEGLDQI